MRPSRLRPPSLRCHKPRICLSIRSFSTSLPSRHLELAFDLHPARNPDSAKPPIVFLHGFFGSRKNNRGMSKVLARDLNRPVYALDLRNHGDSPHSPVHDYQHLAEDVRFFLEAHQLQNSTLIGHSMGAKTAMCVALAWPAKVANLIPVDNAPIDAALKSDFASYVQGMQEVSRARVTKRSQADAILEPYAKDLAVRQFLLTNLTLPRGAPHYEWRIPLDYLTARLDGMGDFPFRDPDAARFEKPTLFVRGTRSPYVPDESLPAIGRFFPRFELADVEAGHWLISENPEAFRRTVVDWLADKDP